MERHTFKRVADRDPENQRRHCAANKERPVPVPTPRYTLALRPILKSNRTEDQREQHQKHGKVEAGKAQRIKRGPRRKDRPAAQNEPDLIAFPNGTDRVDSDTPLGVGLRHEGQKRANAHVEPVGDGEADEEDTEQPPPDQAQRGIVD